MESPRKGYRSHSHQTKLAAVEYAKVHTNAEAARRWNVDPKSIRDWRQRENDLVKAVEEGKSKRYRLEGGGRKLKFEQIDREVYLFYQSCCEKKLRVSRKRLKQKAREIHAQRIAEGNELELDEFVASEGWLNRFMERNKLGLRRTSTICQKPPHDYIDKVVELILHVRHVISSQQIKDSAIFACGETTVWLDELSYSRVEESKAREISVRTTVHEKLGVTAMLCAKADGTKLKPYILLPRKRLVSDWVKKYSSKVTLKFEGSTWMSQALTEDFLSSVVGQSLCSEPRLLIWDSYKCHISAETRRQIESLKLHTVIVPDRCTEYIQAPDTSWKKYVKNRITECYDSWVESGMETYIAGGKPHPPSLEEVVDWISKAWDSLPTDMVRNSFKDCGFTCAIDGSEDDRIVCMQPERPCEAGLELLKQKSMNGTCTPQEMEAEEDPPDSDIDSICSTDN